MGSGNYNLKLNSRGGGKGKQGVHVCPRCRWPFPNPHPSQKKRASHKKQCGLIQGYPVSCPKGEIFVEMRDVGQELNGKGNNLEISDRNKEIKDLHTCDIEYEIENQSEQAVSETNCSEMTEVEQKLGEKYMCILEKSCERKGTCGSEKLKDETDIKDQFFFGAVNIQTPLPGKSVNPSETLTNNEQADTNERTSNELRTRLQSENVTPDSFGTDALILESSGSRLGLDKKEAALNVTTDTILDDSASKSHPSEGGRHESGEMSKISQPDVNLITREDATENQFKIDIVVPQCDELVDPKSSADSENKSENHYGVTEATNDEIDNLPSEQGVSVGIIPPLQTQGVLHLEEIQQPIQISRSGSDDKKLHPSPVMDVHGIREADVSDVKVDIVPADPGSVESAACTVRKETKLIQDQEASSNCSVSSSDQLPKGYCDLPLHSSKQDVSECFVLESARMNISVDEGNMEKTIDGKSINLEEDCYITYAHSQKVIEDIHGTQDPQSSQRDFESNQEERGEEIEFYSGDTAMVVVNGNINDVDAVFCQEDGKKHHAPPVDANSRFSDDIEVSSVYHKDTVKVSKDMEQNVGNLKGNHSKRNTSEVIIEAIHEKSVECSVDSNTMNFQSGVAIHNDNREEICVCKKHFVDIDSENGNLDRLICYSSQLQINGGLYSVGTRHDSDIHRNHGISSDFHERIAPTIISQRPSKDYASPIENDGINNIVGDPTENHRGSSHGESSSTKDLNSVNAANSGILRKLQQSNSNYEDIKVSCSGAGTESRQRKEKQAVKHRATDWTSVKHEIQVERVKIRTSLRDLLMEPNYDTKQGAQYTTRRYISSPLNQPHAMQDKFRERTRGGWRKEDPSSQSAVTLMMHKEWNSPARFPVGRTTGRKTKEQWTPFMCC